MERLTVTDACAMFERQLDASGARRAVVRAMLAKACAAFGDRPLAELDPALISAWRAAMPPPTRWQATQALKQVATWAARWQLVEHDPLQAVANPRPWREEVRPFTGWEQVEDVARALPSRLRLLPVVGAGCGLRPGELLGLDWSAIDLDLRVLHVCASVVDGELRTRLKTRRSRRSVPVRGRVAEALERARPAVGQGLVLSTGAGGPLDLRNVRSRAWRPALAAAGLPPHRIYDLRHTYATWSLRAGVGIYQLARRMGTSVAMIDATYGHLASDADEHERALLDAWDGMPGEPP